MEKELLSIVETAIQHRNILLGFRVFFHSYHRNLSFDNFDFELVCLLEEFDYTFIYTPGKDNVVADMISRYPITHIGNDDIHDMNAMDEQDEFPLNFQVISQHQVNDAPLQAKVNFSQRYSRRFINELPLIFYDDKIVIPSTLVEPILHWYHTNLNHPGADRTFLSISEHFYCNGLRRVVDNHVRSCPVCLLHKQSKVKYGKLPPSTATYQQRPLRVVTF